MTALFVIILHLKEQDELNELIKWLPVKAGAALHRRPAGPRLGLMHMEGCTEVPLAMATRR